ncbi:MAG: hypothetical protein ACYTEP_10690, partial [Planctomycetota bacterium]
MSHPLVFRLPPDAPPEEQPAEVWHALAAEQLEIEESRIQAVRLVRISLDARARHMEWRVSTEVYLQGEEVPAPPSEEPPR